MKLRVHVSLMSIIIALCFVIMLICFQPVLGGFLALAAFFFFMAMREKRHDNKDGPQ